MVVIFSAIGLLLWIAVLFAAMVLCGIIWTGCKLILWAMDLRPLLAGPGTRPKALTRPAVGSIRLVARAPSPPKVPRVQDRPPAQAQPASGIWPKWSPSHRLYKARELSLWQEQFDALDSRS